MWICMTNTDRHRDSVHNYSSELHTGWSIHKELSISSSAPQMHSSLLFTVIHEIKTPAVLVDEKPIWEEDYNSVPQGVKQALYRSFNLRQMI